MSTNHDGRDLDAIGVPELTALGKRIELLRIERRMSKGVLAHRAGTSRQQLWRVMTGKSELTSSLGARLAEVLEIDSRLLRDVGRDGTASVSIAADDGRARRSSGPDVHFSLSRGDDGVDEARQTLEEYVSMPRGIERTFETLPSTDDGRRLKRALLDAIEEIALARAVKLPPAFFDLRRRVVNGE
jgi:transcriptional regulator with XRE-family HTH domain